MELLASYGTCQFFYKGTGILFINEDGKERINCSFTAGQLNNGTIILLCHAIQNDLLAHFIECNQIPVIKFEGTTDEGFFIKTNPKFNLQPISYLPRNDNPSEETNIALRVRELIVEFIKDEPLRILFGITNFEFDHTDKTNNKEDENDGLILNSPHGAVEIKFCKVEGYDTLIDCLSTLRGVDVTCKIILKKNPPIDTQSIIGVMNDICYLLSIKQGTKIVWIYFELYNADGTCVSRIHRATITKDYHPLDIFYLKENGRIPTEEFLERTYPSYLANREVLKLDRGTIDTYLDAKAQHDFLEIRAAKISIAIEKLKFEFLKTKGQNSEYIIPKESFSEYITPIETYMNEILKKDGTIEKVKIQMLINKDKILNLNRRSFRNVLKELSQEFHLDFSKDEISLFVSCRNSLVHKGDFYYRTAEIEDRNRCEPLPSIKYEYFFLINMLDRIFLRVIGCEDTLIRINWRDPPKRILDWLK